MSRRAPVCATSGSPTCALARRFVRWCDCFAAGLARPGRPTVSTRTIEFGFTFTDLLTKAPHAPFVEGPNALVCVSACRRRQWPLSIEFACSPSAIDLELALRMTGDASTASHLLAGAKSCADRAMAHLHARRGHAHRCQARLSVVNGRWVCTAVCVSRPSRLHGRRR
jgi:hypothetical protein